MVIQQDSSTQADAILARTADGRLWGPFDSAFAARQWEKWFSASHGSLFTARDIFEGSVAGDGCYLVSPMGVEFGVHPLTEIYDWRIHDDNGRVVADLPSGMALLEAGTPVLVEGAVRHPPLRRLPAPATPPREADLPSVPEAAFPSRQRGEVIVFREPRVPGWIVAWRADGRSRRRLPVISLHGLPEYARLAASIAAREFVPPAAKKSTRPRDSQREKVYQWEHSFPHERTVFTNIEECRSFIEGICGLLDLEMPEVSQGSRSLENHSHFSPLKGIVIQTDMMNSHTLLHEIAHYAVYMGRGPRQPSHGPRFAGTLAGMLAAFASADLDEALDKAAAAGIVIDEDVAREHAAMHPAPGYP